MEFKAKNGKILTARDDVQAAAFEKAGLKPIKPKKGEDKDENKE